MQQEDVLQILEERARKFRREENIAHEETREMIVFMYGSVRYAIPLDMLTELRWVEKITPLALVSPNIIGVINVRGRIVSVYSLDAAAARVESCFVLVGYGKAGHVAIAAEDIIGTMSAGVSDMRNVPLSLSDKDYIASVGRDGLVFLDLDKFVTNKKMYMA